MELSIEEFVNKQESINTQKNYRSHLKKYFEYIGIQPPEYFTTNRNYNEDFKKYSQSIKNNTLCTRKMRLHCIRTYLRKNKIILEEETIDDTIKPVKMKPQSQDEVPTPEILREIITHGTTKDRALFLFLSSSGIRVGEALQLTKDNIPAFKQLEQHKQIEEPIRVKIPASITKNKTNRTSYISMEAWYVLLEWLKERKDWIDAAARKSKHYKNTVDSRIFPFGYTCASTSWNRLVRKAGYDEKDTSTKNKKYQRRIYHIHILRAYFKNRMLEANVQERWIETLLGHIGYVGGAYDKSLESQLMKAYEKGESFLSVYSTNPKLNLINEDLKAKEERIAEIEKENQRLRNHIQDFELEMRKILRELDKKQEKK